MFVQYSCITSTHTYENIVDQMRKLTLAHFAAQMSEAPMSVLDCNGPCQIKGKGFFYVLRQTQLILHQA